MFVQQIRRSGNSLVITIPREEVDRLGLAEGDFVQIQLMPMELRPALPPELQAALDRSWEWLRPGLEYLKGR